MNASLRAELLALRDADRSRRDELIQDGSLGDGYHARMEEVHRANAARLKEIIAEHGWPTRDLVGENGAEAAWLIVQHAIGDPPFQREMLQILQDGAELGEIPAYQPAYLEDRICLYEGRPQIYGTQFMPDENGLPAPWTIADPEGVNQRRADLGLDTIEERTAFFRRETPPNARPKDVKEYYLGFEAWLRKAGWRP
jgi:hypothetical protein